MLPKSSLLVARHVKETKISIKSDISIVNTDLVSTGSYVSSSSGGPNREYTWQMELVKCASDFLVNRATLNLILMPSSIPSEVAATCDIILTNILNQEVVRSPGQLKIYKRGERVMLARLPSLLKPPLFTIGCDITIDDSTAVVEGKTLPEFSKNVQVLKHRFSSIMFDNLNDFLESQQLCDVTLITADRAIPAHKAILAAQSPVFLAMFSHEMKEQRKNQVDITDLNAEVVMEMVRFIYTGRTTNLDEMADDLLAAANKYQVLALKDLCVLTLCESIATENVVDRLILGDLYDVVDLKNAALNFICTQGQEVIKTPEYKSLGTTHPHLIAEALEASIMARTEYLTPTAALSRQDEIYIDEYRKSLNAQIGKL